jgi:hypothetical protein
MRSHCFCSDAMGEPTFLLSLEALSASVPASLATQVSSPYPVKRKL